MLKKWLIVMMMAVCASLMIAGGAMAGVVSSKHDMTTVTGITWSALQGAAGACSFCHIPHKATGARLWSGAPQGVATTIGTIGTLCGDCHMPLTGKFAADANVAAGKLYFNVSAVTAVGDIPTNSHGLTIANMPTTDVDLSSTTLAGFPYTGTGNQLDAGLIECSTCHDPHNDAQDPFLQSAGTDLHTICTSCHTGRVTQAMGWGSGNGNHPLSTNIDDSSEGAENPVAYGTAFNRALRSGSPTAGTENVWVSGGHVTNPGVDDDMHCETCHAIHGQELIDQSSVTAYGTPSTAGALRGGANRWNQSISLLTMSNPDYAANSFCEGCHTDQADLSGWETDTAWNPGAASTASHPVDMAVTAATSTIYDPGTTAIPGTDGTAVALCRSCHGVHTKNYVAPGVATTPLLTSVASAYCDGCHPGSESFIANHHPANVAWVGAMETAATGATPTLNDATWSVSQLECYNCHRAHNAQISILRWADKFALCAVCHLNNPCVAGSTADGADTGGQGSHYLGAITRIEYKFSGTWPTSSGVSEYTAVSANGEIVCLSCHNLMGNNVGAGGHLLLGSYGNALIPSDTDEGLCRICHKPAQDSLPAEPWDTGWAHPNLANPVIDKTHPLEMNSDGDAVDTAGNPITGGTVTYSNSNTLVNCESCHKAHCAVSGPGSFILELGIDPGSGTVGPIGDAAANYNTKAGTRNNDGLCTACHAY